MQAYSDPEREEEPFSLPDVEVFYVGAEEFLKAESGTWQRESMIQQDGYDSDKNRADGLAGWYWWPCLPGCLPDGEACGPFETEEEATEDAQSG